jgi:hypothetical protein
MTKIVEKIDTFYVVRFEVSTAVTMMIIIFWEMIIITFYVGATNSLAIIFLVITSMQFC